MGNGRHRKPQLVPLGARTESIGTSVLVFYLRFGSMGWADFYVDDEHGTLAVVSDWGTWSHRWGRGPWLGRSEELSRMLYAQTNCYYVADKLSYGVKNGYDPEDTRDGVLECIVERRKTGGCTREAAREAYDYAKKELCWDQPEHQIADALCEDPLREFTGDAYFEFLVYSPPHSYFVLRDQLLPAFFEVLGAHLKESTL